MKTPQVGTDIDASCTRCRLELTHVIVAMDGSRVVRVQCKTCGSVHNYHGNAAKPNLSVKSSRQDTRTKPGSTKRQTASMNEFDEWMKGRDLSRAKRYKPMVLFQQGDVVDHATFGLGVVTRVLADHKIVVAFQMDEKILVHGRGE